MPALPASTRGEGQGAVRVPGPGTLRAPPAEVQRVEGRRGGAGTGHGRGARRTGRRRDVGPVVTGAPCGPRIRPGPRARGGRLGAARALARTAPRTDHRHTAPVLARWRGAKTGHA